MSVAGGVRASMGAVRWRPRLRYELVECAVAGHVLVGTQAARLRAQDGVLARCSPDGLRWYRCLRCDTWTPLAPPAHPTADHPPDRDRIRLPLRGPGLRDRYVLRLIALDRAVHCLLLAVLAAAVLLFVDDRDRLSGPFFRLADAVQSVLGGHAVGTVLAELARAFAVQRGTLVLLGLVLAGYAAVEGAAAVGLWRGRRWAEYLTFVATALLLVPEIRELAHEVTTMKVVALAINIAVVVYLLVAKRLFGVRGGGRAAAAPGYGWADLERATPGGGSTTAGPVVPTPPPV